jgi:beta-galactosidase GanA
MPIRNSLFSCSAVLLAALCAPAAEKARDIPRLEKANGRYRFIVDGSPFLILGGQVRNSTTSNSEDLAKALDVLVSLHANVAEAPIYWEAIEPQPGKFDFRIIDESLQAARKRGLRLVFLWFGTWKNGESHYVPAWVKLDKRKYARVLAALGEETEIISPLCDAAREADARAFAEIGRAHV